MLKEEKKEQLETDGWREFSMNVPRAFISGRSVRVLWSLPKSYLFFNKIAAFQVEFRTENNDKKWIMGDVVDGHVRAVTIKALLPGNKLDYFMFFLFPLEFRKSAKKNLLIC